MVLKYRVLLSAHQAVVVLFFWNIVYLLSPRRPVTSSRGNTDKLKLFTKKFLPEHTRRSLVQWKVQSGSVFSSLHLWFAVRTVPMLHVSAPGDGRPSWSGAEDASSGQDGLHNLKRSGSFTKLRESIRRSSEKLVRKLRGVDMEEMSPRNAG